MIDDHADLLRSMNEIILGFSQYFGLEEAENPILGSPRPSGRLFSLRDLYSKSQLFNY